MSRHETHPHSLKQLSHQNHQVDLKTPQSIINKERENIKENIRNLVSDNVGKWYEQDLVVANVFLYLKPMELFLIDEGCLMVCKNWNQLISGQEFAKYYFENSFCVSTPFFNNQNQHEFDEIDSITVNLEEAINDNYEILESIDLMYEDDEEEEQIEANTTYEPPLDASECVKCFENELGYKIKLVWKNNFYRKFLILVSLMEKESTSPSKECLDPDMDSAPLGEIIENLLKPLNQSQIDKLNTILKKLKYSKLLTNSIKTVSGNIIIFTDSGLPHTITFKHDLVCFGNTFTLFVSDTHFTKQLSMFLPPCTAEEEKTFEDVIYGLFPSAVYRRKRMKFATEVERPPNAYMLFAEHERRQGVEEVVARHWNLSSESVKQSFCEEERKLKHEYEREFKKFQYIISGLNDERKLRDKGQKNSKYSIIISILNETGQ